MQFHRRMIADGRRLLPNLTRVRPIALGLAAAAAIIAAFIGFAPDSSTDLSSTSQARWEQPLGLATRADRIETLVQVNRHLPGVLSDSVTYDRDLLDLLGLQHEAVRALIDNPTYRALAARRRHGLIDIEIGANSQARTTVATIDPGAIDAWKVSLKGSLEGLKAKPSDAADSVVMESVVKAMKSDAIGRSQGIVTGLIDVLPADLKKDAFKQPYASQLATLNRALPKELTSAGFRAAGFGWADTSLESSVALSRLASAREAEVHVTHLLQIQVLLQDVDGRLAGTVDDLKKRIESLNEGSLSLLLRPGDLNAELERVGKRLVGTDPKTEKPFKMSVDFLKENIRKISTDTITTTDVFDVRLVLREVPPLLAAFRGFAGGDGASKRSSIYANSPNERVFLVFDRGGSVKGYAAGTVVESDGKKYFYAHTVNGPNMNATDAESILLAFHRSVSDLGVEDVLIPNGQLLFANVNYTELRGAYEKLASGQAVAIQYPDAELRAKFALILKNAPTYDLPEANKHARALDKTKFSAPETAVQVRPGSAAPLMSSGATRADLALLAINLKLSGRGSGETWSQVLKMGGFSEADVDGAVAAARNEHQLPLEEFNRGLKDAFAKLGVTVDDSFNARYWPLFILGHMNAPDALEPRNTQRTQKLITAAVSRESGAIVGSLLDLHGPYILSEPKWRDRISRSEEMTTLLMSRLPLLKHVPGDMRASLTETIRKRSPELLDFYNKLMSAKTAQEFVLFTPPGQTEKASWVHLGVRSALDHFLDMEPTAEQIRKVAIYMHDDEELFHIKDKAMARAKTASDFLRVSDDFHGENPNEYYKTRMTKFMAARIGKFLQLNPEVDLINVFRSRAKTADSDMDVVRRVVPYMKSAGDFAKLIGLYPYDPANPHSAYHGALRVVLRENIETFARLEPSADEVNIYRKQLFTTEGDFKLLNLVTPKMTSAGEFLKLITLYPDTRSAAPGPYEKRMREFVDENVDVFLNLNPTVAQMNVYRQRTMNVATDLAVLIHGLKAPATTPLGMLELFSAYGTDIQSMNPQYAKSLSRIANENAGRFLGRLPTPQQIGSYRRWINDPQTEMMLIEAGLRSAVTKEGMLHLVSNKARKRTEAADRAWAVMMERHFARFMALSPSPTDVDLYLRNVGDAAAIARLQQYQKSLGPAPAPDLVSRIRSWFSSEKPAPAPQAIPLN